MDKVAALYGKINVRWLLIGISIIFISLGKMTAKTQEELKDALFLAITNEDVEGFLDLFPSRLKRNRYAFVGAESILKSWSNSTSDIQSLIEGMDPEREQFKDSEGFKIRLERKSHFLFFETYYLTTDTSQIIKPDGFEKMEVLLEGEVVRASDFSREFFPGRYVFEGKQPLEFMVANAKVGVEVKGDGERKALEFDFNGSRLLIPRGPLQLSVYFEGAKTEMHLLRETIQEFGPIQASDNELVTLSGEIPYLIYLENVQVRTHALGGYNFIYSRSTEGNVFDDEALNQVFLNFIEESMNQGPSNVTDHYLQENSRFNLLSNSQSRIDQVYFNKKATDIFLDMEGELRMSVKGILLGNNIASAWSSRAELELSLIFVEGSWKIDDVNLSHQRGNMDQKDLNDFVMTEFAL